MKILVIGATGLVGKALLAEWGSAHDPADTLIAAGSDDADIRDQRAVARLVAESRPEWILLFAAYSDVDGCERDPEKAGKVNVEGPDNVARVAAESGARLLFLSTDYVFDGLKGRPYEPDDPRHPLSVYGQTKANAEDAILRILPQACVVRTSWVFGTGRKCFPDFVLEQARNRSELRIAGDQTGSPTYARDLARILLRLVRSGATGTLHASNSGSCTHAEWAREILQQLGLPGNRIRPVPTAYLARPARRPCYSVLSTRCLSRFGIEPRSWQEALRSYLAEKGALAEQSPRGAATVPASSAGGSR